MKRIYRKVYNRAIKIAQAILILTVMIITAYIAVGG